MTFPSRIGEQIAHLGRELAEVKRRERGRSREGTISAADPATGRYRVDFGGGFTGPWMQAEALSSGDLKIQGEPVVGQRVKVTSESGDLTDGVIALSSFTDASGRPKAANGELVITLAGHRLELTGAGFAFTGPVSITGPVTIEGDFAASDGAFTHNGTNVGDDHKHEDTQPGIGTTVQPEQ
ncbi:hypothetical protein [Palleronia sp.]|uniref:hypothetical protein n=1 Tax=Palleronia sp. TaxID=1940284 RepID=UPI0035C82A54